MSAPVDVILFEVAVVVAPTFGRAQGGVGASLARLIGGRAFAARRSVVLTPDSENVPRGRFERRDDVDGAERYAFGWKTGDGAFLAELVRHFLASCGEAPALVVAFYVGELAFPALAAGKLAGARTLACARGNDVDQGLFGRDADGLERALRHADAVTTVTTEMAAKLALVPACAARIVWNSVDFEHWRPIPVRRDQGAPITVGMFGELKEKKGLAVLLEALDFERFALRIVGRLRESEAKLLHGFLLLHPQYEPRIAVESYALGADAILAAYHAVDVVCLPSFADGMPNVLLEAMAAGRVTVSSRVGGAPEVVEDGVSGFLCAPRDAGSLRDALERAARVIEADGGKRVGEAARARILGAFSEGHERAGFFEVLTGVRKLPDSGSATRPSAASPPLSAPPPPCTCRPCTAHPRCARGTA